MRLRDRTALVTGGAVRIGRAIVEALAAAGCRVVVHYRNSEKQARDLVRRLRAQGVEAWAIRADLSDPKACAGLVAAAAKAAGRLDILVNNAAVFHKDSIRTATRRKLQDEFGANLYAPLLLLQVFARRVKKGKVVNLLDRRIASNDPACVPYVLSKKALAQLTRTAARELAPRITVNAVAPGPVLPPPGKGMEYIRDMAGPIPLGRKVEPEEIAEAVLFLLRSDSVTGQTVFVDGGQNLL